MCIWNPKSSFLEIVLLKITHIKTLALYANFGNETVTSLQVRRPTGPIDLNQIFYPGETFKQTLDYLINSFGTANRKELESIVEGR